MYNCNTYDCKGFDDIKWYNNNNNVLLHYYSLYWQIFFILTNILYLIDKLLTLKIVNYYASTLDLGPYQVNDNI